MDLAKENILREVEQELALIKSILDDLYVEEKKLQKNKKDIPENIYKLKEQDILIRKVLFILDEYEAEEESFKLFKEVYGIA